MTCREAGTRMRLVGPSFLDAPSGIRLSLLISVQYGIPLDSRSIDVKTDFAMWMSAIYHTNSTLRDLFINGVYDFLDYGESGTFDACVILR